MSIFNYLANVCFGLPTHDSTELIAAKRYRPSADISDSAPPYDLYSKEMDPFMFGAITPVCDANDLLDSKELEKRASEIYKRYER